MIAAVIFDLDGVLIDSEQVWDAVREELAHELLGATPGRRCSARRPTGMSSLEASR